ncbi:beta-1,6-N-acetylglucosaminyltransferase [Bizionia myxarmorum]|uniref:Peptide O-xylosyltransferase n=1 Tax=Bizionia myxarmorum TaxID=291186 RepID=A0A5D0R7D4_9FLAO|nr:beta-1,6-N-acetylglucosaminyltransferase [Bizionia myxarmorum]TYB76999.1 beta-1,6-N-acetylglucosaminyltransferase [Bizionia myxarmorum]
MKQAILITGYKDIQQLKELVCFFDASYFNIYIHLDRKSKFSSEEIQFLKEPQVKLITNRFKVNWGGFNHLKAYLYLSSEALKDEANFCFHLITGQDFPVKSISHFKSFGVAQMNEPRDYLAHHEVPFKRWSGGGVNRLTYYHLYDWFDAKKHKKYIRKFVRLQVKLGIARKLPKDFLQLHGGSTYWTLSKDTLQYVMNYTYNNPKFLKRFKFSFCAEELYFHTIILNAPFADLVVNDNLRHIDWSTDRGSTPVVLDERDYEVLLESTCLFARKFDRKSFSLKEKIKVRILNA